MDSERFKSVEGTTLEVDKDYRRTTDSAKAKYLKYVYDRQ
jgi:hypothetical protein